MKLDAANNSGLAILVLILDDDYVQTFLLLTFIDSNAEIKSTLKIKSDTTMKNEAILFVCS